MSHRPRALAATSAAALAAGLLYGAVAPATANAAEGVAPSADGVVAGIETVGPIPTVASSDGDLWPTMPLGVAVMPRGTVLSGDFPLVYVPSMSKVESIDVRVRELSSPRPESSIVFEGILAAGWTTVTQKLETGGEYAVEVAKPDGTWQAVGSFSVAVPGSAVGPAVDAGGMRVSTVTGQASWSWRSPNLPGPAGGVHAGISWVSGSPATAGLPAGWRLTAQTGSAWATLEEVGRDVEAIDVPTAVSAGRLASSRRVVVDFAYPKAEAALAQGFILQVAKPGGAWVTVGKAGRNFADAAVDARVNVPAKATRLRVGVRVDGTVVWGRPVSIRSKARPVTTAPVDRHLASAGSGSVVTAGDLPSVVRLHGWNGSYLTFVRNALGIYEQMGGDAPGFTNVLTWIKDGEWEFADTQGVVTRFVDGRARSVTAQDLPTATMSWDSTGRLTRLTNEVGRSMDFTYAGAGSCPSWSGFAAAPEGMLCKVSYPGGAQTELGYVDAGDSTQVALIKDSGNVGTALGWDDRGRLVSTRGTLVNRVATIEPQAGSVVSTLEYSADGRVATVNAAPAEIGGKVVGQAITYPVISEAVLRGWVSSGDLTDAVTAETAMSGSDYRLTETTRLDPVTWQVLDSTDASGLRLRLRADDEGAATSTVDAIGRSTRYEYNDLGLVTTTMGPFAGSGGPSTTLDYDTARVNGSDKPLNGLRAQVYSKDSYAGTVEPEFWPADYSRSGLSASWSNRGQQFSAQATGVWTPGTSVDAAGSKDGWQFEVSASGGSQVSFIVGGTVCEASAEPCVVRGLPKGPKSVTVQVKDAPSSGWFSVAAAPVGESPKSIASDEVGPGYALTTSATSNDAVAGSENARTDYVYTSPELGQPSSVVTAGDLTTRFTYEPSNASQGAWGRLLTRTTPGGETQTTAYWPDRGTAALPVLCGGDSVEVSGQPKMVVRQDGTSVTSYYDIDGNIRASVVQGQGETQTFCSTFGADGLIQSSESFDTDGKLVERVEATTAVGGDPRVSMITVTHGEASAWSKDAVKTATSRTDLAGREVSGTDMAGTQTVTTYDEIGNVTSRTITPPSGSGAAAMTATYTYDRTTAMTTSVRMNGVLAASVDVDPTTGEVSSVTYADGITTGVGYFGNGQVNRLTVSTPDPRFTRLTSSVEQSAYGRIESESLSIAGSEALTVDRGYTYDSARRLSKATVIGATDAPVVYEYAYGSQSGDCPTGYVNPGKDGLRTGGSRSGTAYATCYDAQGRVVSTTDPLVTGGEGSSSVEHDAFGRVTRVTGPRALAIEWGMGTRATEVHEIAADESGLTSTRFDYFGATLLDRTLVTDAGTTTTRMSGPYQFTLVDGEISGTTAIQYGLPGGVTVTTAPGATATMTIPGVSGSAMVTVEAPSLGFGQAIAPGTSVGLSDQFGPYGEPLVAPDVTAVSPVPTYSWMARAGLETLPGTSSITMMGSRPYHPLLGAFLAPDPGLDSGDNLYAYTNGDPINSHDISGNDTSEPLAIGAGSALGAFAGALLGGFLKGRGWGKLGTAMQVLGSLGAGVGTYIAVRTQTSSEEVSITAGVLAAIGTAAASYGMSKWSAKRSAAAAAAREARSKVILHVDPEPVHVPGWADYLYSGAQSEEEVLKIYKSRALKYHPDKGGTVADFQTWQTAKNRRIDQLNGKFDPPPAPPQNPAKQNFQPPAQQKPAYNPRGSTDSLDSDDMDDFTRYLYDMLKKQRAAGAGFD